jgi:chromosomal replication initiator protein
MHRAPLTFARFVARPENRAALLAVNDLASRISEGRVGQPNLVFLHGPVGSGKTHLAMSLVNEVTRQCPELVVSVFAARDLSFQHTVDEEAVSASPAGAAYQSDLVVVEDLQQLPPSGAEPLVQLLDYFQVRRRPVLCTALAGPQLLRFRDGPFPARLASRLAGGLVVGLESLQTESRLALLQEKAQRRQFAVRREVLAWLAERVTGGGRQLEGALVSLESLSQLQARPLDVDALVEHFQEHAEQKPTVQRIAQRVSGYFRVDLGALQSRTRCRNVLVPRQVGMYLSRRLTELSLTAIGGFFGGRDHSTVLHSCHKVEQDLSIDPVLSGAVRQLERELA